MDPQLKRRLSPNGVALIFVLLLASWLVFVFYPQPTKPAPSVAPVVAESKLRAMGLEDNPDWDGLPEIFAIFADQAEWKQGRTRFAYWHPVMKTYSYYFEAIRDEAGIRFKAIAEPHDPDYYWDEEMAGDSMISFYYSVPKPVQPRSAPIVISDPGSRDILVKINMDKLSPSIPPAEKIVLPKNPATIP